MNAVLSIVDGGTNTHKEHDYIVRLQLTDQKYRPIAEAFLRYIHQFFPALRGKPVYLSCALGNEVDYFCGTTRIVFPADAKFQEPNDWEMIVDHDTANSVDIILSGQQRNFKRIPKRISFQRKGKKTEE